MSVDTTSILQKILQQALVNSGGEGVSSLGRGDEGTEEMIVNILGNRLGEMFKDDEEKIIEVTSSPTSDSSSEELAHYEELIERNGVLASALGACDCWGEQADCLICHGAGEPGWTLPDRRLFSSFVKPAINAIKKVNGSSPHRTVKTFQQPMEGV